MNTNNYYSNEKDILNLLSLIKKHNIKRAIVSPGSTNISFAASLLYDEDIEVYSAIDERSAAYMACGLAEETGEPVIISCTGATAARNYVPALTEAFYRKLPILAVTSSQFFGRVGQHIPQVTDRNNPMNDICVKSVQIPIAHTDEDEWSNNIKMNDALLALRHRGGGPVHINIETSFSRIFSVKTLPEARVIYRVVDPNKLPKINAKRIIIFVGAHSIFTDRLTRAVDEFCSRYNAIVVCDHTSNYKGRFRVLGGIVERQCGYAPSCKNADLIIHLGEVSGSYYNFPKAPVWRVNSDGVLRDTFKSLSIVFEMDEETFFESYNKESKKKNRNTYFDDWKREEKRLYSSFPELPFSNAWIAQQTASQIPEKAVIHFGILNSLRMWNLFELPLSVYSYSNVGGFGIDGSISSLVGASFSDTAKLFFLVLGDLATFYDLNSFGNRHIGNNLRILVVNNGTGFEMRHSSNRGDIFRDDADILFAAGGHNGGKSRELLKHFTEDLGFEYLSAENKEDYLINMKRFVCPQVTDKPIIFEVFVNVEDEYNSYEATRYIIEDSSRVVKNMIKNVLGERGIQTVKELIGKKNF